MFVLIRCVDPLEDRVGLVIGGHPGDQKDGFKNIEVYSTYSVGGKKQMTI